MPRYQIKYESENITVSKHLERSSMTDIINAVIEHEHKSWDGKIISIELEYLGE